MVCQRVGPRAIEPVRISCGTVPTTSYEMLVMVGRISSDSASEPANHENPSVNPIELRFSRNQGTRMVMPSQPQTTLGIPTNTSIAGCAIDFAQRGAISDMKMASPTDSGVEMIAATIVTASVPAMNGSKPNCGGF